MNDDNEDQTIKHQELYWILSTTRFINSEGYYKNFVDVFGRVYAVGAFPACAKVNDARRWSAPRKMEQRLAEDFCNLCSILQRETTQAKISGS